MRRKIVKQHEDYNKGFLYFIGHDPRVPQHLRDEMLTWGYPNDEYLDQGDHMSGGLFRDKKYQRGDQGKYFHEK